MESLKKKLTASRIMAVLSANDASDAVETAKALIDGGINAVEMTLRSDRAFECISAVAEKCPDMLLGVGTVLTPEQVVEVKARGATFAVSPGCNVRVVDKAREIGLPFAPGIMTPSDIEQALEHGCRLMKFFPAQSSGGIKHLESMAAPYKHLGVSFIPLGGVNFDNMNSYLASPLVCAIGGSWIASAQLIKARDFSQIRQNAQRATEAAATA